MAESERVSVALSTVPSDGVKTKSTTQDEPAVTAADVEHGVAEVEREKSAAFGPEILGFAEKLRLAVPTFVTVTGTAEVGVLISVAGKLSDCAESSTTGAAVGHVAEFNVSALALTTRYPQKLPFAL